MQHQMPAYTTPAQYFVLLHASVGRRKLVQKDPLSTKLDINEARSDIKRLTRYMTFLLSTGMPQLVFANQFFRSVIDFSDGAHATAVFNNIGAQHGISTELARAEFFTAVIESCSIIQTMPLPLRQGPWNALMHLIAQAPPPYQFVNVMVRGQRVAELTYHCRVSRIVVLGIVP